MYITVLCRLYYLAFWLQFLINLLTYACQPYDAHCCHMGTAMKHHPVPDRAKPPFVIFDIRAL